MGLLDEIRAAQVRAAESAVVAHLERNRFAQSVSAPVINPCNCIGPQNGEPVCPCQMRCVTVRAGRYVMERDLGPAPAASGSTHNAGPDEHA